MKFEFPTNEAEAHILGIQIGETLAKVTLRGALIYGLVKAAREDRPAVAIVFATLIIDNRITAAARHVRKPW